MNGRHQGIGLGGRVSAISLPLGGASQERARCHRRCVPPHRMSEDAEWPVYRGTQAGWGRLRLWGSCRAPVYQGALWPHREREYGRGDDALECGRGISNAASS